MKAGSLTLLAALALVANLAAQEGKPSSAAGQNTVAAQEGGADAAGKDPVVVIDFVDAQLSPSHWTLSLHPDGRGHFQSEMGTVNDSPGRIRTPDINRDIQLSSSFSSSVFQTAQKHSYFNQACESHMKVAFQGNKTFTYNGPDGKGSCTFNYSKDREIQALGDNFAAVAETIIEGQRLEMLLQHDPLGLDKEMQSLVDAAQSGRAQQLCAIKSILERLVDDDRVLELVRKRAKSLLAQADS